MKTFEELQEVVNGIVEMETIFRQVVVVACHQEKIHKFLNVKDRVMELLVKDIQLSKD